MFFYFGGGGGLDLAGTGLEHINSENTAEDEG